MVEYTDDKGEMDGASGKFVQDLLPPPEQMAQWPVYVYEGDGKEGEALVEFRHGGKVDSITVDPQHGVTLHFENGQRISAALAKQINFDNRLITGD